MRLVFDRGSQSADGEICPPDNEPYRDTACRKHHRNKPQLPQQLEEEERREEDQRHLPHVDGDTLGVGDGTLQRRMIRATLAKVHAGRLVQKSPFDRFARQVQSLRGGDGRSKRRSRPCSSLSRRSTAI
jgi:hypothetical protein